MNAPHDLHQSTILPSSIPSLIAFLDGEPVYPIVSAGNVAAFHSAVRTVRDVPGPAKTRSDPLLVDKHLDRVANSNGLSPQVITHAVRAAVELEVHFDCPMRESRRAGEKEIRRSKVASPIHEPLQRNAKE
jgi:hypothetical protein